MPASRYRRPSLRRGRTYLAVALAIVAVALAGCSRTTPSYSESRAMLGTTITITVYGDDEDALRDAVGDAFSEMEEQVVLVADAWDPDSEVAAINADPYSAHEMPWVLEWVDELTQDNAVREWFDVRMWGVGALYEFGDGGDVPARAELAAALELAATGSWNASEGVRFEPVASDVDVPDPGLDLGGAAKGVALDVGWLALLGHDAVEAALLSAGSSTLTRREKPDGDPWRIGIEDPRDTGRIVATIESELGLAVSTSGDYQQFFERDGVRYHHILDPRNGSPAPGIRSVTVASTTGAESDILATALFVAGVDEAVRYAEANGIPMYLVDDNGRAHVVPGRYEPQITIEEVAEPLP